MKFSAISVLTFLSYAAAAPIPEDSALLRRTETPYVLGFSLEQNFGGASDLSKRDSYMSYQAKIAENDYYYSLGLAVGFPQQKYKFLVDTTSSNLWIANDTFVTDKPYYVNGDTMLVTAEEDNQYTYPNGATVNYTSALTRVNVARKTLRDVPLGIAYNSTGISNLGDTSGYVGLGVPQAGQDNILTLLKSQGYTNRTAFSLALFNNNQVGSTVLFGGFDHGKYAGNLYILPREDVDGLPAGTVNGVKTNSIIIGKNSYSINSTALIDATSSFTYVPTDVYNALFDYYNVDNSEATVAKYGNPTFNTQKYGGKKASIDIAGVKINFSGVDIALENAPQVFYSAHDRVFGFKDASENNNIVSLGLSTLQSMYLVFDYDGDRIGIAQINENPGSTRLIPISDTIKYSRPAPDYA